MRSSLALAATLALALAVSGCGGGAGSSGPAQDQEVGDDTYVPSFKAGNLSFTDVWVEDNVQSGVETKIWFDVTAEEPKFNVYVRLDLLSLPDGNASDLVIDSVAYKADYFVSAIVIDKLERGEKRKVEHSFVVPEEVKDGTYAAVFTINAVDFFPDDNSLQGEVGADRSDNFLVAPATVIVGRPDRPNLRILSQSLAERSFDLKGFGRSEAGDVRESPILSLNLEVESMAQHTVAPVEIAFELEIEGHGTYPLRTSVDDGQGGFSLVDRFIYPTVCRTIEMGDPGAQGVREATETDAADYGAVAEAPQQAEVCAALFRQSQVGRTYDLYLTQAAYDALSQLDADTAANLTIRVDPDGNIEEWSGGPGKTDNVKKLPVTFMSDGGRAAPRAAFAGPYDIKVLNWRLNKMYGNEWFGAGYVIGPDISYRTNEIGGKTIPTAFYAGTEFSVPITILKKDTSLFSVFQKADFDIDDILGSAYDYGATVLEYRIWGQRYGLKQDTEGNPEPFIIWKSTDANDNERFAKRQKFFEKTWPFVVVCVPITVKAVVNGEVGIRGKAEIGNENKLTLGGGPYARLLATAEGERHLGAAKAGVGGNLVLVEVGQKAQAFFQLLPAAQKAIVGFSAPLYIESLSGKIYLFGERLKWKWWKWYWTRGKATLIEWGGHRWAEHHWFTPLEKTWQ